ncbi:unnamed protein product [Fusarium equiseti]|uniref:Fungal N-terminal domain-containing protein n=1 Tax=Fusarium equiseti TaxID=61235 RepID=A0A8J2IT60_FUSEQ|nr:unnamed protein product [Fusarium equiseti]
MEPVSLLIGIVPLCAQLAKTTTTINNLISTYKSAARELEALSNTLTDVATVCESLGDILYTTDPSKYHPSEARLFAALHGRIQECHDRLTDIQDIIQIVNGKRRGPFRNEGFLFLQFKDKISFCTKSHLMEVAILKETNSHRRSSAAVAPDRVSISGYIDTSPISTDVSRKSIPETTCVMKGWQRSLLGLAFIARTRMQKKTVNADGSGPSITEDYSTFTVGSPLSSRSIKVCITQDCFSPLYMTLQIPCVIQVFHQSSSLGERILNAYMDDDPEEIRQLLQQRSVTTTTLLGWYDHYDTGYTMLGLAAALTAPRILAFARSQMTMIEEREHFPDGPGVFNSMFKPCALKCVVDYINMRKNGMSPDELHSLLTGVRTFSQLKACTDAYLIWSPPTRGRFHKVLGIHVLKAFCSEHLLKLDVEDWASLISEHIVRGFDIYSDLHTDFDDYAVSTLASILRYPACSDVAVSNLHSWLDVLKLAGVEIGQYLDIETPQCFATWGASANHHMLARKDGSLINRVLRVQYSRGRLIPYWREEIDRACPIRELLIEFPRFLHSETMDSWASSMSILRLRRAWKAGENTELIYPEKLSWPVAPQMEDEYRPAYPRLLKDMTEEYKKASEWVTRQYYQRERRRERNLERKLLKGTRKKKSYERIAIPGSWVD